MFDTFENFKLLSSYNGFSKPHATIENRKSNAFLFRISGSVDYNVGGKTLRVNEGDMIFIPRGSTYSYLSLSEDCAYVSLNFLADIVSPVPTVYNMENFSLIDYIYNHFAEAWKKGNSSDKYKCHAIFYELLSYLSNIEHAQYSDSRKKDIIKPALEYLQDRIFDFSLRVDELHKLCGISDTYFRKIFISIYGTTPQKYITNKRISHAKSIIDSGDFDTISEIALSVGYTDPLYFSRAFKNKYGTSPSDEKKQG